MSFLQLVQEETCMLFAEHYFLLDLYVFGT